MSDKLPRIAIVTPTLNCVSTLERTLRSVREQAYSNLQHIIIDGGSTDGTLDVIRAHESQLALWVSEPDQGISDAFNKGITRADGELVAIINADDYYEPGALHAVAQAHLKHVAAAGEPAIYHGDMIWRDAQYSPRRIKPLFWGRGNDVGWAVYFNMPINHPTCFVHRMVYEKLGLYDKSFRLAMDVDFVLRAWRAQVPLVYLPRVQAHFCLGGVSNTHPRKALVEMYRAQRKNNLLALPCLAAWAAKWSVNRLKAVTGLRFPIGSPVADDAANP